MKRNLRVLLGEEEVPRQLTALEPMWDGTPVSVPELVTDLGGGPVTIRCCYGTIQLDKRTAIYYKGNMASSGLAIRVNDLIVEKPMAADNRAPTGP